MNHEAIVIVEEETNKFLGIRYKDSEYMLANYLKNGAKRKQAKARLMSDISRDYPEFESVWEYDCEKRYVTEELYNKMRIKLNSAKTPTSVQNIVPEETKRKLPDEVQNPKVYNNPKVKKNSSGKALKVIAATVAAAAVIGASAFAINHIVKEHSGTIGSSSSETTEREYTDEELANMSFDELHALLNSGLQQDTFRMLEDTQNYMNETTLPSVKFAREESQLYIKADEIVGTFITVNADRYDDRTFDQIFADSGILDATKVSEGFLKTADIMHVYYSKATQRSGISSIFTDNEDKALVEQAEDLVIAYNSATNAEDKKEAANNIIGMLKKMGNIDQDSELMDPAYENQRGATAYIYTTLIPWLTENRIIDSTDYSEHEWDKLYEQLINLNENVTCNELHQKISYVDSFIRAKYASQTDKSYNGRVVLHTKIAMDNDLPQRDRDSLFNDNTSDVNDVNTEGWGTNNRGTNGSGSYSGNGSGSSNGSTIQKEINRNQAVSIAGEAAVSSGEAGARQSVADKNAANEALQKEWVSWYSAVYQQAKDYTSTYGTKMPGTIDAKFNAINGKKDPYVEGYNYGIQVYNGKQNADPNGRVESTTQTPVQPTAPMQTATPTAKPTNPPTQPTNPPTQPTNPPTQPTNPPTQPTNPPTQPTQQPTVVETPGSNGQPEAPDEEVFIIPAAQAEEQAEVTVEDASQALVAVFEGEGYTAYMPQVPIK